MNKNDICKLFYICVDYSVYKFTFKNYPVWYIPFHLFYIKGEILEVT